MYKAIIVLTLLAGAIAAMAIAIIWLPQVVMNKTVTPPPNIVAQTRSALDLPADSVVTVQQQVGDYYRLQADPQDGGGGEWILLKEALTSTIVIATGQDYPECSVIEPAGVPVALAPYCWTAPSGGFVLALSSASSSTSCSRYP